MNRVEVKMMNGAPIGLVQMANGKQRTMSGLNLIRYLGRIDESLIGRKVRRNPFIKNNKESIVYISKLHQKNIRIENNPELIRSLYNLYLENRKALRQEFDDVKKKKVGRGLAATAVIIGGLALASMADTSKNVIDIEKTASFNLDSIKRASHDTLEDLMDEEYSEEQTYTATGTITPIEVDEPQMTEAEINAMVNAPSFEIDIEPQYDPGIQKNLSEIEDTIKERSNRWGVSEELLRDIISMESSGGKDTNGLGVGQFEFDQWLDNPVKVYNFEEDRVVKVVFTHNPQRWYGKSDYIITAQDMKNIKTQISVAAIVLQYLTKIYKGNLPIAINTYNSGLGNMDGFLERASKALGKTKQEIIDDKDNLDWTDFAYKIEDSGKCYFEWINKHVENPEVNENNYYIRYMDSEGNPTISSIHTELKPSMNK